MVPAASRHKRTGAGQQTSVQRGQVRTRGYARFIRSYPKPYRWGAAPLVSMPGGGAIGPVRNLEQWTVLSACDHIYSQRRGIRSMEGSVVNRVRVRY